MRDKSPCDGCEPPMRQPGCQSRCEIGIAYQARQAEKQDRIKAERNKDRIFDGFKSEQVYETKKRAGVLYGR